MNIGYFTDKETAVTTTGLANIPNTEQKANIDIARIKMNKVREVIDKPVNVTSWFRSKEVNAKVGGSSTSSHLTGYAIDFYVRGMTNREICDAIDAAGIKYDQLIDEFDGVRYWVHISFDPKMRNQKLIARKINGKMNYQLRD